jgi:hypothetical protein
MRFLLAIMAFFGYCIQYMLKINLGIAIVCMVNFTALSPIHSSSNMSNQHQHHHHHNHDMMMNFTNLTLNNYSYFEMIKYADDIDFNVTQMSPSSEKQCAAENLHSSSHSVETLF